MFDLIERNAERARAELAAQGRDDSDVIRSLRAWAAKPEGIGQTWINWYALYRREYLKTINAPMLEAAE